MIISRIVIVLSCLALVSPAVSAAPAEAGKVSFRKDVAPILLAQCQTCHGAEKVKGKFRVDTFERLWTPGSSGDAPVNPGYADKSTLYRLLVTADADDRMPKKADPLPKAQIEIIRKWIDKGATFDGPDKTASVASYVDGGSLDVAPTVYKRPIPITTLAFTDGGKSLLAGGFHELTQWDPKTGKLAGRVPLPIQRVQSIAVDGTSGRVAVVGGTPGVSGELLLINPGGPGKSLLAIASLVKASDVMLSVRFSPDGKTLAAGGADGSLRVFDVASGKLRWRSDPHADWVTDVSFSPDNQFLVTASRDKSCRVFEVKTGLAEASYNDHTEPVFAAVFSGDGGHVFTAGRDRRIHMWASSNGNAKGRTDGFGGDIVRLERCGDRLYSVCADGTLREHASNQGVAPSEKPATQPDAKKKEQKEKPQPRALTREIKASTEWLYSVTASEESGLVAVGSHDGKVHVYDIRSGKPVADFVAAPK
ncbi:c-type cytochrome domain-containing protein [Humisphaera borealis]|uniref:PQQ-binding-like beta-propeller repeat protein n=1 Tax=Humisphaera borealis TaxID=2807512 RepID=A0A7M2WYL9_9BACT|nr:c-type cytochrome domain-containing protein [Humisphaera borealis]QOV90556.1 PQQ-binding-like beta-propeller repeat protein [Humisphaera borealis]